jgi:quercetin dioxygenase-like cupin family protein
MDGQVEEIKEGSVIYESHGQSRRKKCSPESQLAMLLLPADMAGSRVR